jgi:hypothetical protein
MNTWDIGVLNMQTRNRGDINAENFGVLRLKRRILNDNSTVGGILTTRFGNKGRRNIAYGLDGLIRISGDDFLTVNWSQTFDHNEDNIIETNGLSNGRLTVELNRRRRYGFGYNLGLIYSGEDYRPELGFVDRSNIKFGTGSLSQTWLFPEGSKFILQTIDLTAFGYWDNMDNVLLSSEVTPQWRFTTRTSDSGAIGIKWIYEHLLESFSLSKEVAIPVGDYRFARLTASYSMAGEKIIRSGVAIETGPFYDGWLHSITLTPSWFVSKHLELGLQYSFNHASFSDRDESLDIHIARLRVGTAVNSKISTNTFIQYNSEADLVSANVRFRYNIKEGNDLWIVFNEGLNTDRFTRFPNLPVSNAESILVKYIHTFVN